MPNTELTMEQRFAIAAFNAEVDRMDVDQLRLHLKILYETMLAREVIARSFFPGAIDTGAAPPKNGFMRWMPISPSSDKVLHLKEKAGDRWRPCFEFSYCHSSEASGVPCDQHSLGWFTYQKLRGAGWQLQG